MFYQASACSLWPCHLPSYGHCNKLQGNLQSFNAQDIDKCIEMHYRHMNLLFLAELYLASPHRVVHVQDVHRVSGGCPEMPGKSPLQ